MSQTKVVYYLYKGYTLGCSNKKMIDKLEETGKEMLEDERKKGRSDTDIKIEYLSKMDRFWNDLNKFKSPNNVNPSKDDLKRMVDSIKDYSIKDVENERTFLMFWATTLIALLELEAITEDDNNGLLTKEVVNGIVILY